MPVVPAPAEDRSGGPAGTAPRILVRCSFGISQIGSGKASEARTKSLYHRSNRPGKAVEGQESVVPSLNRQLSTQLLLSAGSRRRLPPSGRRRRTAGLPAATCSAA